MAACLDALIKDISTIKSLRLKLLALKVTLSLSLQDCGHDEIYKTLPKCFTDSASRSQLSRHVFPGHDNPWLSKRLTSKGNLRAEHGWVYHNNAQVTTEHRVRCLIWFHWRSYTQSVSVWLRAGWQRQRERATQITWDRATGSHQMAKRGVRQWHDSSLIRPPPCHCTRRISLEASDLDRVRRRFTEMSSFFYDASELPVSTVG